MISFTQLLNEQLFESEKNQLLNSTIGFTEGYKSSKTMLLKLGDIIPGYFEYDKQLASIIKSIGDWKHSDELYTSKLGVVKTKGEWYDEYKSKTPAFTLTSYAEQTGLAKEIKNPYIIIDIDNIEVTDELFNELNRIPFVIASGKSFSGRGIYSIIKFDRYEINNENFNQLFEELEYYYDFEEDVIIDKACKNINRLRVLSPYELVFNVKNYKGPYKLKNNLRKKENYVAPREVNTYETTGNTKVQSNYVFRQDSYGNYYREEELPKYMKEFLKVGSRYELFWRYADTIYKYMGDSGYEVLAQYFPDNYNKEKSNFDGIWKSAKNRNTDLGVSGFIKRELIKQKLIKSEIDYLDVLLNV